jgi:hypothetical protein
MPAWYPSGCLPEKVRLAGRLVVLDRGVLQNGVSIPLRTNGCTTTRAQICRVCPRNCSTEKGSYELP